MFDGVSLDLTRLSPSLTNCDTPICAFAERLRLFEFPNDLECKHGANAGHCRDFIRVG